MPINQQQTMTASAVRPLLRFIEQHDIPLNEALKGSQLTPSKLTNDRLTISCFDKIITNIARLSQHEDIGFITGRALELQSFSLLGLLLSACETGRDALLTMRRYYMLLSDSPAPEIFITKNQIKVLYHISHGSELAMRARAELIATAVHTLGRSLGGNIYQPIKLGFKHPKPKYHKSLDDFFAVDIAYNEPECWISLTADHIDQPLQESHPILHQSLQQQAESLLSGQKHLKPTSNKVRHVLQRWPNQNSANKETVAELLNTSPRTLTRRLQEEKTQFSHILRDVRMGKAQEQLQNYHIDMQEIAHELGFADRRGFERAFKQWSGITPSAFHKHWRSNHHESEPA